MQRLPGVESAALVSPRLPFDINFNTTSIRIDGKTYESDTRGDAVSNVAVSPGYFDALGAAIVEGRAFTAADREGAPFVAIVNEAMARRFWPDGSAVGRTFTTGTLDKRQYQIVGVAAQPQSARDQRTADAVSAFRRRPAAGELQPADRAHARRRRRAAVHHAA